MPRDPSTLGVNLGTRIAGILSRSRVESTAALMPHVRQVVTETARAVMGGLGGGDRVTLLEVLDENFGTSPLDERTASIVDGLYKVHPILATPILAVALGLSVFRLLGAAAEPFVTRVQSNAYRTNPTQHLEAGTAAQAVARGFVPFDEGEEEAAAAGLNDQRWRVLTLLATQRPQLGELFELVNRGEITEGGFRQGILNLGFDEPTTRLMMQLRYALPGPQDVVRFAVRDVYRPAAVSRGGLLEDLPNAAIADAERVGLTAEEFTKYWASHWVLPSVTNAFEMFHRRVITRDELDGLLRTQDIAPGWRDELAAIAFNVISRVDIRRMYREGIADRERVYETYLDQGYRPEDAEALTQFAVADATVDARELTKTEVVALYQAGAVNRADAEAMLTDLGFPAEESEWLLILAEFRRFRRFRDLAVSRVRSRYAGRRITEEEAVTALDRIGVAPDERTQLLELWEAERDAERPALSAAMVGGLFRDGMIAEEEARVRWAYQGYRSDDIDLLVLNYGDFEAAEGEAGPKRKQLTKADVGRALREGTIDTAEAVSEWMGMGYTQQDARLLAANYLPEEET